MAQDVDRISSILGEPLRLVLDLKSRRVPPRVWSRLIDSLRTRGLVIEGIGSFDVDELRVIGKGCSYPLTPILFFHSVGDLQRACHANEVNFVILDRALINATGKCLLGVKFGYSCSFSSYFVGQEWRHSIL